jgi:hypothetical protein
MLFCTNTCTKLEIIESFRVLFPAFERNEKVER